MGIRDIDELRGDEADTYNYSVGVYEKHYKELNGTSEKSSDDRLENAVSLLSELANAVNQQQDCQSENEFCPNLARSQFNTLQGEMDEVTSYILATRIGLIEYELGCIK